MPVVRSIAAPLRHEIDKIKGSRFIASLAPVPSEEEALAFLRARREEFRDATHNCFAWRLGGDAEAMRCSDDGEPSGTAGRPILGEIDGRRLRGVIVVVSRYYGGTKLGTGGLLRAYSAAAAEALERARIVETEVTAQLILTFGYSLTGPVRGVLAAFGLEPGSSDFGAEVRLEVAVPVERLGEVRRALGDAAHGRIRIEEPRG